MLTNVYREYWGYCFEDMLTCIARLPRIAALIYRNVFFDGKVLPMENTSDMSENFCKMLGMIERECVCVREREIERE